MTFFAAHPSLEQALRGVLQTTWDAFPTLAPNQLALTWVVYTPPYICNTGGALTAETFWQHAPLGAAYRGLETIYPASVVKLFYLVAAHEWMEREMVPPSAELDRALTDMIVDSSNDATSLVVDQLTGTTSGPELPPGPFQTWQHQRNLVNRYYQGLGWPELTSINVNQKPWCDGPYGRERAFLGTHYENRNRLTTDATARLLHSLVGGVAVSARRSTAMLKLMQRVPGERPLPPGEEDQVSGFLGGSLPPQAQLYSKAGYTSTVRHDAAYIEPPEGHPYLLVVFVDSPIHSQNRQLLPFISAQVAAAVAQFPPDLAPEDNA